MGKRSQRRRLQSRKDQGGCMGGLISIFDFRHARLTRNLLLDKKHASKHPNGKNTVQLQYKEQATWIFNQDWYNM